jgi:hypothetical protein
MVKNLTEAAKNQTDKIIKFFAENPFCSFTPAEIWRRLFPESVPITSVRRSISNLESEGKLQKTNEKVVEQYGRPNYKWRLRILDKEYKQGELFVL